MPGMSITPSAQNVATTSSVRPSSSACAYAARVARTPSATSAYVTSEADIDDGPFEGVDVQLPQRRQQLFVRKAGEEPVDRPVEVRDVALDPLGQAHVLEPLRVEAALLPRQVREVLRRDRRDSWVVARPRLGRHRLRTLAALREPRERPDLHQRLFRAERTEPVRGRAAVHRQDEEVREAISHRLVHSVCIELVEIWNIMPFVPVPA